MHADQPVMQPLEPAFEPVDILGDITLGDDFQRIVAAVHAVVEIGDHPVVIEYPPVHAEEVGDRESEQHAAK